MSTDALLDAPSQLDSPLFGLYRGTIASGPPTPSLALPSLRRKRWIFVGVFDPAFVLGVAIADLGYASNAFAYVGAIGDPAKRIPDAWKSVAPSWCASVDRSCARWRRGRDALDITLPNAGNPGLLHGSVALPQGGEVRFSIDLIAVGASGSPITCVASSGDGSRGRWNLTVKDDTLRASGTVRWAGVERVINAAATYDVTDAYPPRHTEWHWASAAGTTADGRSVGLNLCAKHNDSDRARENALWIDGMAHPLGAVRFALDRSAPGSSPWTIVGEGVDLRFDPSGLRDGHEDLKLVKSDFVQPYGLFTGTVTAGGETVRLEGVPGVVEDHEAWW